MTIKYLNYDLTVILLIESYFKYLTVKIKNFRYLIDNPLNSFI